jgi:hypothetical protein
MVYAAQDQAPKTENNGKIPPPETLCGGPTKRRPMARAATVGHLRKTGQSKQRSGLGVGMTC